MSNLVRSLLLKIAEISGGSMREREKRCVGKGNRHACRGPGVQCSEPLQNYGCLPCVSVNIQTYIIYQFVCFGPFCARYPEEKK